MSNCELQNDISLKTFIDLLSIKSKLTFRDGIKIFNVFNSNEAYYKIEVIINYNACTNISIHPSTILRLSIDKIKKHVLVDSMNLNQVTYQDLLLFLDDLKINNTRIFYDVNDFNFENAKVCRHSVIICRPHKFIDSEATEEERNFYILETEHMIYDGIVNTSRFENVMDRLNKIKVLKSTIISQLKKAGFIERHIDEPSFTHFCINGIKTPVIYTRDVISIGFVDNYICITARDVGPGQINMEWEKFVMYSDILNNEIADFIEKYALPSDECEICYPVEDDNEGGVENE